MGEELNKKNWFNLFHVPVVKKYCNCVCYATKDPFGSIFRGAEQSEIVLPTIERTPSTKRPRNGDIMIWWDKIYEGEEDPEAYHFAIVSGGYYLMMNGRRGDVSWNRIRDEDTKKKEGWWRHRKRVKRFKLPLLHGKEVLDKLEWVKRNHREDYFDLVVKYFELHDAWYEDWLRRHNAGEETEEVLTIGSGPLPTE
jgi:hypothetical protein